MMSLLPYWHSFALVGEVIMSVMAGYQVSIPKDKKDFARNIGVYRPTVVLAAPRIANVLMTASSRKSQRNRRATRSPHGLTKRRCGPASRGLGLGILRQMLHLLVCDPILFRKVRTGFGGRLRFIMSGGAPLDVEPQIFFKSIGVPLLQGYGLTEATPIISTSSEERGRIGSCGTLLSWLKPGRGGDFTFRDEEGHLGPNLHGELLVRGDCVMKGIGGIGTTAPRRSRTAGCTPATLAIWTGMGTSSWTVARATSSCSSAARSSTPNTSRTRSRCPRW